MTPLAAGQRWTKGSWVNGLAEWTEGDTAFLSIAFTWRMDDAYQRAIFYRAQGFRVRAGGPGVFTRKHYLADVAELGGEPPANALLHHNPMATIASRGCPVGCWFCIVPAMEGKAFTLLPDFEPRPVLCDNNLSALPGDFQDHIVSRYLATGVPLIDANSGFEPRTFDEEVFRRWQPINRGPWRFASDDAADSPHVERVMKMLDRHGIASRRRQVYTMIGGEPFDECMERIRRVIAMGGEPYAQPLMKLNALDRKPWVRFDWTETRLRQVARWVNGRFWKYVPFDQYRSGVKTIHADDRQMELAA
jgi:hypothetical protein